MNMQNSYLTSQPHSFGFRKPSVIWQWRALALNRPLAMERNKVVRLLQEQKDGER